MFSEKNNNPDLILHEYFYYPVYIGSREDVEKIFQKKYK